MPQNPSKPPPKQADAGTARRAFTAALRRSRAELVPPAFADLWQTVRFSVWYGGRAAAKSWSIARVLLTLAHEAPLRVLCCREIQGSIRESAYRLLADQIVALQLDGDFEVQSDNITAKSGSRFYFEGLRYNASKIRSYEGVDIVWVEEAQNVSDLSWETLLPTIRKAGSRFYVSFNPLTADDPVGKRFVDTQRPDVIARKVSWRDNPHLSPEAIAEKDWLEKTDGDAYRHVWEGFPRTVSDALILRGKYVGEAFEVSSAWAGPYHGLDYGFSRDPSAAVRCYVDDDTRTLYVTHEYWALGADIDALPGALEAAVPGISRHVVYADAARPESTSYLARNGIPNARSVEKWPGSVDDGIAYLRSFARIVIDPSCRHLLDECATYSFKTDRLTGVPLPEPEDKNNHLIDALRYALSPLIRNQPTGGYFSRGALLMNGEPVEPQDRSKGRPLRVLMTLAACEAPGTALGVVYWAYSPHHGDWLLAVLDYELVEFDRLLDGAWLASLYERAQELRHEWDPVEPGTTLWVEQGQLCDALVIQFKEHILPTISLADPLCDLARLESKRLVGRESKLPLVALDDRCQELRSAVNAGGLVKVARSAYARQLTHRSSTTNHLLAQLLGYRPGAKDAAQELVAALMLGCLVLRDGDRRAESAPSAARSPALEAPPPPVPPKQPGLWLPVGTHEIDGARVDVARGADGLDMVFVPLSIGRHTVDGRLQNVVNPNAGITVRVGGR